ncbi:MAG: hypothetical protein NDJ90_02955 [Oligoflexia bacterium]|nr:hypothetical protein [Oligoflexia bacterium]
MLVRRTGLLALSGLLAGTCAFAEPATSVQPYIDSIRGTLKEKTESRPSLEEERERLRRERPLEEGSFIEKVKQKNPEKFATPAEPAGFIEERKGKMESKPQGGAIQALHEGRSELKARFAGDIHNAAGFRVGATLNREVSGATSKNFEDMYGSGFAPDVALFYEYQPFRSEWLGNIGLYGSVGASYFKGSGAFQFPVKKAWAPADNFGSESKTRFQFFVVPVSVGLDYRFNLFHFIRPFVIAAPTAVGYFETRNDTVEGHQGYSKGLYLAGGASLLLDWFSRSATWDQYATNGVRHSYLTIEYSRLETLSGDLDFSVSGLSAGFTFEY